MRLPRKLKKAIRSLHLYKSKPIIYQSHCQENGTHVYKVDQIIKVELSGKTTKAKIKARCLVYNIYKKSMPTFYLSKK